MCFCHVFTAVPNISQQGGSQQLLGSISQSGISLFLFPTYRPNHMIPESMTSHCKMKYLPVLIEIVSSGIFSWRRKDVDLTNKSRTIEGRGKLPISVVASSIWSHMDSYELETGSMLLPHQPCSSLQTQVNSLGRP